MKELGRFLIHLLIGIVIVLGIWLVLRISLLPKKFEVLGFDLSLLIALLIGIPVTNWVRRRVLGIYFNRERR